jgi:radical SAM superfamily enzyme YgiQ (UPF0313 family)
MFGRKPRVKDASQIIAELDALYEAGWRERVFFVDDNLIGHKPALRKQLLPALSAWQRSHRHLPLCTQVSINLADDAALTRDMVEAGFDIVFIGIESPTPESLAECSKSQNINRDMIDSVRTLQRAGMEVQGGFIVGFDHDTPEIFQAQADFIARSGIVTAMVGQLQAAPGTRLKKRLAVEGRLRRGALGHNTDGNTNFVPAMGLETLRDGHAQLLRELFMPGAYYRRIRTLLEAFPSPARRRPITLNQIKALGRAVIRFGVVSDERGEFWKLLAWTCRRKPRLLSMAVRLAAIGHHHRRMTDQVCDDVAESRRRQARDEEEVPAGVAVPLQA